MTSLRLYIQLCALLFRGVSLLTLNEGRLPYLTWAVFPAWLSAHYGRYSEVAVEMSSSQKEKKKAKLITPSGSVSCLEHRECLAVVSLAVAKSLSLLLRCFHAGVLCC